MKFKSALGLASVILLPGTAVPICIFIFYLGDWLVVENRTDYDLADVQISFSDVATIKLRSLEAGETYTCRLPYYYDVVVSYEHDDRSINHSGDFYDSPVGLRSIHRITIRSPDDVVIDTDW